MARTLLCLEVLEDRITPSGFQTLYNFTGGKDGGEPWGGVILDGSGNLYGTTTYGGTGIVRGGFPGYGTLFEISSTGAFKNLYTFDPYSLNTGSNPTDTLISDSSGNLYGTTSSGPPGEGTVFKYGANGTYPTLYSFTGGSDGEDPIAGLIMDNKGDLFGTTSVGGPNGGGTVFELSPNGSGGYNFTTLYGFNADLGNPSGLVMDSAGNLYGTASGDFTHAGVVFKLSPDGSGGYTYSALHIFDNSDGANPVGGLILDGSGNLYGTTYIHGPGNGGTVFKLSTDGSSFTTLYNFNYNGITGANPEAPLLLDSKGNLFGTTYYGGASKYDGVVFELSPNGNGGYIDTTLHSFDGSDGANPAYGGLVTDGNGNLYGTTSNGGTDDDGTVFEITGVVNIVVPTTTASNVTAAFSTNTQNVTLTANVTSGSGPVNEGTVTFTILQGNTVIGQATTSDTVSNGQASVSYALPANPALGTYTIDAVYNPGPDFSGSSDSTHTLTVTPANVTTTANNVSTAYAANAQTVKFTALVADTSIPSDTVNEGTVTFTIMNGNTTLGSVTGNVSGGTANANFSVPAGQVLGSYSIDVGYSDSAGNFTDTSDTSGTLTITGEHVATIANNVSTVYSSTTQTLNLSAALTDTSAPGNTVTVGTVTFTILNGSTTIGTVQGNVENGTANANFNLPGGTSIGNYTIGVSYSDGGKGFEDGGDNPGTLTIAPSNVVTTAAASNITFNPAAQTVALNATVVNNSLPSDSVGEGTVTFTIKTSQFVVGSVSAAVSGGTASADFNWSPGRAAGTYTIAVSYQDSQGNYLDSGDLDSTLTVAPALVTTTAANASAVYSPNAQTVVLSASVSCPSVPIGVLDTEAVTFTVENGSTIVGSVQGAVSGGTANANFDLPAGLAAGIYTIAVSYSDSHGNFIDGGDTGATLSITPASAATTANNAVIIVPNSQSVTLSAVVADSTNPTDTVNEGAVTFTVMNGTTAIGNTVQGTVSGGAANADFTVPTGLAAGSYALAVNYSDSNGNFSDSGDTSGTLTVLLAPDVTASPSDETVPVGGAAIFTAAANASPMLTVQWQVSSDGGKTFTNISGATSTTLTLSNVQASENGNEYQAVFTNSYGTATTSAATLSVPFAPTVTTNPTNQTVTAGQNATFTAAADGSPTPTVQWQVSTDGGKTFTNISGATSTTLTLNSVQASANGYAYQAVFTNSIGTTTTSFATLSVQFAPTVTSNPSNQTATAGDEATFTTTANGNPAPTVQWQVSTDGGKTFSDISGATSLTLTLVGLTTAMSANQYQAVFTNSIGSTTTSAATLTVNPAIIPVITGNPTGQTVSAGATVSFTASASGDPAPTVQWQVSTDGGATFSNINGATSTTLTLTGVAQAMNGYKYQAVFSNGAGSADSTSVTLTVNAPPSSPQPIALNVPPLLALLGQLIRGIETVNANDTETVVYSLFGIALVRANYDGSGNFVSATLFGFSIPNSVWFM